MIEFTISKKPITDYEFDVNTSYVYIQALQAMVRGDELDDIAKQTLKKKGLYTNGKLRVFNFKRGKKNTFTISEEVKSLIGLWNMEEPSAVLWYKNKTFVESLQILVNRYGFERIAKVIAVLVPLGNRAEYVKNIRNPQQLIMNYGDAYISQLKKASVLEENTNFVKEKQRLLGKFLDDFYARRITTTESRR